jgi:hypothetical protein
MVPRGDYLRKRLVVSAAEVAQRAGWPSGPELVHGIKVGWMTPDLAHPAITEVEDLDTVVLKLLARPLAADRDERDSTRPSIPGLHGGC